MTGNEFAHHKLVLAAKKKQCTVTATSSSVFSPMQPTVKEQ